MRYNPVLSAYEKMQAVTNLKLYQELLQKEAEKIQPNLSTVKYYRTRIESYRQKLGIKNKK
ncbi:MAG: hypothetical protein SCK28_04200 [Bacillota bacterium]|nr:hypothetical protein [Bacillota bacterium]